MFDTDTQAATAAESDDVDVMVCELAKHNIGFMYARDANEDDEFVFLVFGL